MHRSGLFGHLVLHCFGHKGARGEGGVGGVSGRPMVGGGGDEEGNRSPGDPPTGVNGVSGVGVGERPGRGNTAPGLRLQVGSKMFCLFRPFSSLSPF